MFIRKAIMETDLDRLVELRLEQQKEEYKTEFFPNELRDELKYVFTTNKNLETYVIVEDKVIVSTVTCDKQQQLPLIDDNGKYVYLTNVYTLPTYRRRGFQKTLLLYVIDILSKEGYCAFYLDTDMPGAVKLYESIGFEQRTDYYSLQVSTR